MDYFYQIKLSGDIICLLSNSNGGWEQVIFEVHMSLWSSGEKLLMTLKDGLNWQHNYTLRCVLWNDGDDFGRVCENVFAWIQELRRELPAS